MTMPALPTPNLSAAGSATDAVDPIRACMDADPEIFLMCHGGLRRLLVAPGERIVSFNGAAILDLARRIRMMESLHLEPRCLVFALEEPRA